MAKSTTSCGVEDAFFLEASEGVGVEHFGPLVTVVTGGVASRAAEEVAKVEDVRFRLGLVVGVVAGELLFDERIDVFVVGFGPVNVQLQIHLAKRELANVAAGFHVVARGQHFVEQVLRDGLASFVVTGKQVEAFAIPAPVFQDL